MIRRRIEEAQALDAVVRDDAPGRHSQQQESQPLPSLLDFSLPPLLFDNDGEEKYTEEEKERYEASWRASQTRALSSACAEASSVGVPSSPRPPRAWPR